MTIRQEALVVREANERLSPYAAIVADLSDIGRQTAYIFGEVYARGHKTAEDKDKLGILHAQKDSRIMDLLLLRRMGGNSVPVKVALYKNYDETLHPFSKNLVRISVPITNEGDREFVVETQLNNLRRKGVCEDSLQAVGLLGEFDEWREGDGEEDDVWQRYFKRTRGEILNIFDEEKRLAKTPGNQTRIEQLDELIVELVIQRLYKLRLEGKMFLGALNVKLVTNKTTGVVAEHIRLFATDLNKEVAIPGTRIGEYLKTVEAKYDSKQKIR